MNDVSQSTRDEGSEGLQIRLQPLLNSRNVLLMLPVVASVLKDVEILLSEVARLWFGFLEPDSLGVICLGLAYLFPILVRDGLLQNR